MAKTDPKQEKAFNAMLKKAKAAHSGEEADALEPIAELVFSFLTWNATVRQADSAFGKIMAQVVDLNELRVSHAREIVEMVGVRYPDVERRVIRLLESMMEIFDREHDYRLTSVKTKGKREQREYLDMLPGIPAFVAARVALLSFGAHAMPVDDRLLTLMVKAGVFDEGATPAEAEAWLVRQVKAGEAEEAYLALQEWADGQRVTLAKPAKPAKVVTAKKNVDRPDPKKAPTKKATTKKSTTKKSTTKKPASKKRVAKKK